MGDAMFVFRTASNSRNLARLPFSTTYIHNGTWDDDVSLPSCDFFVVISSCCLGLAVHAFLFIYFKTTFHGELKCESIA